MLIVEDETGIRELLQHGLGVHGAAVDTAETVEEAWNRAMGRVYDVILCDCNLGQESGSALVERIMSSKGEQAPQFVLMTGQLLPQDDLSAWEKRGVRVLLKPFSLSDLIAVLEGLPSPHADLKPAGR